MPTSGQRPTQAERELFWRRTDDAYARLAADPAAWAEMLAEREAEAPALRDGLDDD